ncbi:ferric iron reductase [Mesorhizobium sp. SB112]|uniref:ferric iron reductase n=1 Tax=Mesorhizobium sp. SB112 TaxID=3151853 RepID=UPI0032637CD0
MQVKADQAGAKNDSSADPLAEALTEQSRLWPEVRTESRKLEPGWITAEAFFAADAAIDEYLDYEGSFHAGADRRTCAASMMIDYCYVFSMATVPLFVGFGIVPELTPQHYAMRFYIAPQEHDGRTFQIRRAHVRFLSRAFWTDKKVSAAHPDARGLPNRDALCDLYRHSVEDHVRPLIDKLASRTGLSRNALWRLVSDAVAGRFLDAGRRLGCLEEAKAMAMTILKQSGSPLNNRQLHYFDLTLRDDGERELISWAFRARGGCCRYYTVEGGELCDTCVLKKPEERDAELLEIMRHRFAAAAGNRS